MTFESLGLAPALLRALAEQGYTTPTPIQAAAIPLVLEGGDLLAGAQTGTGKTAAFALPLLQKLGVDQVVRGGQPRKPRALILTPTRELAAQVHDSLRAYGKHLRMHTAAVFGGVGMGGQIQTLRRNPDIIVATPGRLIDHMDRRNVDLSCIDTLVLDEADRMLDMGFAPALKKILGALPKQQRQTLLFSATFVPEVKALAAQFMHDPREVQMAQPNAVAVGVSHRVHPVDADRKRDLLLQVLAADSRRQTLVFARTKHGSDKLCKYLDQHGFRVAAIHGNKSQGQRTRALADFKAGKTTVLVATDIAARGLDIAQLPAVVNYDLPMVAQDYVHRIGRTGRAGAEGLALSLVSREEEGLLRDIRRLLKQDIAIEPIEGFEPAWNLRLDNPAPALRKQGRHNGNAPRNAKPGKPSHVRRPHAQHGKEEHAAGNKRRRSKWRGNAQSRNA
ncbi:MAG TPA: DEAD/DEAH box helicase [Rhodanobacteraceae bacterium]|jgi:ATP-dependent RNA helicase RhlE|nr:DEAD/DEAH box helicase [Rhodanobacteraceae bacterium]